MTEESCTQAIQDLGNKIRELKVFLVSLSFENRVPRSFSISLHLSFKSVKKDHEEIPEILPQLKAAKDEYKKITGKDYDQEMKKKEKEAQKLQKAAEVKDGAV